MGLLPLEFTDCLIDSPYFRENLHAHEKELESTSQAIKVLIRDVKELISAARNLSRAQRNLGTFFQKFNFESIGTRLTDDEIVIAGSLKMFGNLLMAIEDERDRMLERAQDSFIDPIEKFRKEQIGAAKEWKKKFEKDTAKFCQSLERHLNLSTRKSEAQLLDADASLEMEQRHFFQSSLHYIFLLQEVQERKKFEFVETILTFMYGWLTFYHQGHEVATEFKSFMTDLQIRLQRTRENFYSTHTETAQLKDKMLEVRTDNHVKPQDPGAINKMYTRQGYLFIMEKKALVTNWVKCFCMYKKDDRSFTMIPYSQTAGKISSSDTFTLKECIKRSSQAGDKRFCFDVMATSEKSYTIQALSEEDQRLWLEALGGTDGPMNGSRLAPDSARSEEFALDERGFSFVRWCIDVVEKHGLEEQGIYRLVGVASKVQRLTPMVMDSVKELNYDKLENVEIKTVTSAMKNYFRCLKEPLMTYRLHLAFIEAAKLGDKRQRIEHIHSLVHKLPKPNFDMLQLLIAHLGRVVLKSSKNMMPVSNLGVCFGPTLLRSEVESVAAIMDIKFGNVVVEILIEHYDKIFKSKPLEHAANNDAVPKPRHQVAYNRTEPVYGSVRPVNRSSYCVGGIPDFISGTPAYYPIYHPASPLPADAHRPLAVYNPSWQAESPPSPGSSSNSSSEGTVEPPPPLKYSYPTLADGATMRTLYACMGENESELSFKPNQIIYNVRPSSEPGWLEGWLDGRVGLVPANYVELLNT